VHTVDSLNLSIPLGSVTASVINASRLLCTVCISLYSVYNELCGRMRVAASRTKYESYPNMRIALYTSCTSRTSVF